MYKKSWKKECLKMAIPENLSIVTINNVKTVLNKHGFKLFESHRYEYIYSFLKGYISKGGNDVNR